MKGKFIVIYGINNIGKTVQSKRLTARLRRFGKKAVFIKYPVYGVKPTGPILNNILRSGKKQKLSEEELQLLFVLNRYQFQPELKKMLSQGIIVVAEDYRYTGVAWGVAKGASLKELEAMNRYLLEEDLAILMEGRRKLYAREKKHLHETKNRLSKKCVDIFRKLGKKYRWKKVYVEEDKDDTEAAVWKIVSRHL